LENSIKVGDGHVAGNFDALFTLVSTGVNNG
jgi:hypothetical protein